MEDNVSTTELLNKEELNLINKYLGDTVDIIQNQITPFLEKNSNYIAHIYEDSSISNLLKNNIEFEFNSLKKINHSLNNEINLITQIKNNIPDNKNSFIESLANILVKRNELLNDLISLFFAKIQELIYKDKNLKNVNIKTKKNNKHINSLSSSFIDSTIDNNKRNTSISNSKNKEFKIFFTGRKYENMVNYDNQMKNKKKGYNNKVVSSKSKRYKVNNKNNQQNITTSCFNINDNKIEDSFKKYKSFETESDNIRYISNSCAKREKKNMRNENYSFKDFNSKYLNRTTIKNKKNISKIKKKNNGRTSSVIKEFRNNYNSSKKENLNMEIETVKTDNFFNWEKLNLDKLNEIGINLLTNNNRK